jgi:hypothetical protein
MEQGVSTVITEIQNLLKVFFSFAGEKGATIQGDVTEFIKHTATNIENLIKTAGSSAMDETHSHKLNQLGDLAKRMHDQVEHNSTLSSFWEDMVQEIPDFIEWTETVLKEGEEVIVEVAAEVAEVGGEVAAEAATVGAEIAPQISEVIATLATEL